MRYGLFLSLLLCWAHSHGQQQGLRGSIKSADGVTLGYASVVDKESRTVAGANSEGRYEIKLAPGPHTIFFQFVGYKTEPFSVDIAEGKWASADITLSPQALALSEVEVARKREDPAGGIMRRAIASATIHRLRVQSYSAQVYIKGGGRLVDAPWLLEGRLKKEGIDKNTVYFIESVSDVTYRAPNFYKNRTRSVRSNMGDFPSPVGYVNTSFYDAKVGAAVSPLSPRAFSYYRFFYEGVFIDKGVEVNKIRVQPRDNGDDLYEGSLYIVDQTWEIHSLDLTTKHEGVKVRASQIYAPVQQVWMPISQKYKINGSFYGFEFEGDYLASLRNYTLTLDPKLAPPAEVVDERSEPVQARELKKDVPKTPDELEEVLKSKKPLTVRQLRKLNKVLKKERREEQRAKDDGQVILSVDSTSTDSTAYKKDSTYWEAERAVPLTEMEKKSTVKLDSIRKVQDAKEKKDSARKEHRRNPKKGIFRPVAWLLFGHNFALSKRDTAHAIRHTLRYSGIDGESEYNTIEGYVAAASLKYRYLYPARFDADGTRRTGLPIRNKTYYNSFTFGPHSRWGLARHTVVGALEADLRLRRHSFSASGGRYVQQLNPAGAISPLINSAATLFFERNYMRLLEKDFLRVESAHYLADRLELHASAELAERRSLVNHATKPLIDWPRREFPQNVDENLYAGSTWFARHRAAVASLSAVYTPSVRYRVSNGSKDFVSGAEPYFHARTALGVPGIASSTTNYLTASLGVEQRFTLGIRAVLHYYAEAGTFIYNRQSYLPDFTHFEGNRTVFILGDPIKGFRTLPYYLYSTPTRYVQQHLVYTPRRFLITRFAILEALGWRESLGYHGLTAAGQPQFSEAVYGIDGFVRFIRVEGVAVFTGIKYQSINLRIGITLKGHRPPLRRVAPEAEDGVRISL